MEAEIAALKERVLELEQRTKLLEAALAALRAG
jgi:hypothetical protein